MLPDHAAWSAGCARAQRHEPEAGPRELRRHDEIRGHERPFCHGRERTRLGRFRTWPGRSSAAKGGQAVGAQSIAASCGTHPDYSCFNWITFALTNLLPTAGIATPTIADWMARLDR